MANRTKLQQQRRREYREQINRLRRQQRRMEARGYKFFTDPDFIPNVVPESVTKRDVDRLRRISAAQFYSVAHYVDDTTGEVISALEGRRMERSARGIKAAETRRRNKEAERGWFGDVGPDWVPTPPKAPDVELLISFLKEASQLLKYGGWIRDENKGRFNGGSYKLFVDEAIITIRQRYNGLTDYQKFAVKNRIATIMESEFYKYIHEIAVADTVLAFNSVSTDFRRMVDDINQALTDVGRLTE